MDVQLRYISVSPRSATLAQRERYYLPESGRDALVAHLLGCFPDLKSLMILGTCNRTEIYFESPSTTAGAMRQALMSYGTGGAARPADRYLFKLGNRNGQTLRHLLRVAAGLESSVLGDAEIIHQIKNAYLDAVGRNLQGTYLERAMQTVFRSHKRISNETAFRDGTTSTAYKALKTLEDSYGTGIAQEKKILLVGAGNIVQQVLKYNKKFGFGKLYITNRTTRKAEALAADYDLEVFPWDALVENRLGDFDAVISAVSGAPCLIRDGIAARRKVLLVDLAVPGNIDKRLASRKNAIRYDLDTISSQLERTRAARRASVQQVEAILADEWGAGMDWYARQPLRSLLAARKRAIRSRIGRSAAPADADRLTNRILRHLVKHPQVLRNEQAVERLVSRNLCAVAHAN